MITSLTPESIPTPQRKRPSIFALRADMLLPKLLGAVAVCLLIACANLAEPTAGAIQ